LNVHRRIIKFDEKREVRVWATEGRENWGENEGKSKEGEKCTFRFAISSWLISKEKRRPVFLAAILKKTVDTRA
jgi:hypothetical protein